MHPSKARKDTAMEPEDSQDLRDLRAAKDEERNAPTIPLKEARKKLGL